MQPMTLSRLVPCKNQLNAMQCNAMQPMTMQCNATENTVCYSYHPAPIAAAGRSRQVL